MGTVGSGVVRLLVESADHIERHAGRRIVVERAVVKDVAKARSVPVPGWKISSDIRDISRDPSISVAALLVGGLEPARSMMIELLENGKDVVTANKALLAEHGPELFELARKHGRSIAFEAAVAGGIPIVAAIGECLAANRIESIRGILNGTSNFILTRMEEDGANYADVLKLAQQKGFAIEGLDLDLLNYAGELGYRIRLVAVASRSDGKLAMRVAPALVKIGTPLAETRGAYTAVSIVGDAVGRMFFHGLGAGQMPTASAVVADIIDTVVGRAAITFRTTGLLAADSPAAKLTDVDSHERHFLRINVSDRPGVLAKITGLLGDHGISIASVIQHAETASADAGVPLVIMTHACASSAVQKAVAAIDKSDVIRGKSVCLGVLDE